MLHGPKHSNPKDRFRIPSRSHQPATPDAVHLAFASVYKINYLLTWNCKHLANAVIQSRLQPVAQQRGCPLPIVCTPLQLMGTIEYEG
jgi:hypothetical protein